MVEKAVDARSGSIAFEEVGRGRPIIFLHGFGASSYVWRDVIHEISEGHKAIAIDLKGFGKSAKPRDDLYSVADQAVVVGELIEALDLTDVILVGHSFGGGVALQAALNDVDGRRIRRLVLIDAMAYPQRLPSFIRALRCPLLATVVLPFIPPKIAVRSGVRQAYYQPDRIRSDVLRAYANNLCSPDSRYVLRTTARQIVPRDTEALIGQYSNIQVPTLVLWGAHDRIIPLSSGRRLAQTIPGATLAVLEDCGHAPHEELPIDTARAILAFLSSSEGERPLPELK